MIRSSTIAVLANHGEVDAQALLSRTATAWRGSGARVVGVIAEDNDAGGRCSAGFLRDIVSGRTFSIQLAAAPVGTTCHLDNRGVEDACEAVLPQIAAADIVIVSKFGKLEAMRQGLWTVFSAAVAAGKPLLTTVSSRHAEAWTMFAPQADWLEPEGSSIEQWWRSLR